jgi:hypothetical protein
MPKDLSEYKRKYDMSRHHAWAGSVLLAVLLAVRIFLETSEIQIDDWIIISIGVILVIYTLTAVFLTYKYRSGLSVSQEQVVQVKVEPSKTDADIEKERLKIEKKKAKAEAKKAKKTDKK